MAKKIVIDSSVLVKWISNQKEKHLVQADKILKEAQKNKVEIYTSELAKFEVGNALLKGRALELPQAYTSLATIYKLPITFVSETEGLARATYRISKKHGLTYYDGSFLALAENYKATLITDNPKHQQKAKEIMVKSLASY